MKPLEIRETCPTCNAKIGHPHEPGCSVERCPFCGGQMIQDQCCYMYFDMNPATLEEEFPEIYENGLTDDMSEKWEKHLQPHLIPWDGVWPGVRECREYGLWSKWTDHGWEVCNADDPDASEDLNTLAMRADWDRQRKRYVLR